MSQLVSFVQARISSKRFPGKSVLLVDGIPSFVRVAEASRDAGIHTVVITTDNLVDDVIVDVGEQYGLEVYRGDEHNVLKRYADAAAHFGATDVMRLTGDCCLLHPTIIKIVSKVYREFVGFDYVATAIGIEGRRNFPDGLDCEVFSFKALKEAEIGADTFFYLEHPTKWVTDHSDKFKILHLECWQDYRHVKISLDTLEDWFIINKIAKKRHGGTLPEFIILCEESQKLRDLILPAPSWQEIA